MKVKTLQACLALTSLLCAASLNAELLVSESFEYNTTLGGTSLSNTVYQGGSGWSKTDTYTHWTATDGSGLQLDDANSGWGSSLAGSNSVGNRAYFPQNGANARSLETGFALNRDYYTAFLARTDGSGDAFSVEFSYQSPTKNVRWAPFSLNSDGTIGTRAGTNEAVSSSSLWSDGVTYLVVSKWQGDGDHSYTKIFDVEAGPSYMTEVDWVNEADVHADGGSGVTILDVYLTASSGGVEIDEFKVGTTYADVVRDYSPASESIIAFESLDYGDGSQLSDGLLSSGNGWSSGWVALSGGGLETYNKRIHQTGAAGSTRPLANPFPLNEPNDYYFSFFARTDANGAFQFNLKQTSPEFVRWAFSRSENGSITLQGGTATDTSTAGFFEPNKEYFVISKFETEGDLAMVKLIDPENPGENYTEEPSSWDLIADGGTGVIINRLDVNVTAGTVVIDDIAFGTQYTDVIGGLVAEVPIALTPAYGSSSPYAFPNFSWTEHRSQFQEAGAPINYEIEIASDVDFTSIIDEDLVGLPRYVHDHPFAEGSYYWRVRSITDAGRTSVWSAVSSFTVTPYDEIVTVADYTINAVDAAVAQTKTFVNEGKSVKLVFPSGEYTTTNTNQKILINLDGVSDVAVEGTGAHVHFMGRKQVLVRSQGSTNVSVSGFKVTYDTGAMRIQGRVTAVDTETDTVKIKIEPGYPDFSESNDPGGESFLLLDPTNNGRQKTGSGSFYRMASDDSFSYNDSDDTWSVTLRENTATTWEVGDRFVFHFRTGSLMATQFNDSEAVTLYGLSFGGWPNFMTASTHASLINILNVNSFFQEGKWMIGNGDGIHLKGNTIGPWVENTNIIANGDDGIALYARPASMIDSKPGGVQNAAIFREKHFNLVFGNEVSFYEPTIGEISLETRVISVVDQGGTYLVHFENDLPDNISYYVDVPGDTSAEGILPEITQVWNRSKSSGDFMIRNGKMTNNRRYAIVQRARRGIIENMEIRGASSSSIIFQNAPTVPNGLYPSEIIVRNNLIQDSGFLSGGSVSPPLTFKFAAYQISARSIGPRNLLIENNTFNDLGETKIRMNDTGNAVIRNNRTYDGNGGFSAATRSVASDCVEIEHVYDEDSGDDTPPAAPSGLVATAGMGHITLEWPRGSDGDTAYFKVYRSSSANGPYTVLADHLLKSEYVDENLYEESTWYYTVAAFDVTDHKSIPAESVNATTLEILPTILHPVADAYVQGGDFSENNYGSSTRLACKTNSTNNFTRHAYLRYDLSSITTPVASATLRIKVRSLNGSGDQNAAYTVGDDSWSETTINWNNKPSVGDLLDSDIHPAVDEWLELDVTAQVAAELEGNQLFSVALIANGSVLANYHSREADAGNRPELVVLTQPEQVVYTYDVWAASHQLSAGPLGHSDTDEVNNLLEYALGGNPTENDAASVLPISQSSGSYFYYSYNERTDDPSLTYTVEVNTDIAPEGWTTDGVEWSSETVPSNALKTVTNRVSMDGTPRLFIRLRVEQD